MGTILEMVSQSPDNHLSQRETPLLLLAFCSSKGQESGRSPAGGFLWGVLPGRFPISDTPSKRVLDALQQPPPVFMHHWELPVLRQFLRRHTSIGNGGRMEGSSKRTTSKWKLAIPSQSASCLESRNSSIQCLRQGR